MQRGVVIESDVPARLDALPWARFHTLVIVALGITWILDGLEVTLAGAVSGALKASPALRLTDPQVGLGASAYLAGAVMGAFFFGWLTDLFGRKRLFFITLGVYLAGTAASAFSVDFATFALARFITGAGIGGEYAAINSAIDELLPARVRGRCDLAINGSYWFGTALGAASTLVLLDPALVPHDAGWRLCFGLGAMLGGSVLLVRRHVPESPRWLLLHGHVEQAERVIGEIEREVARDGPLPPSRPPSPLEVKGAVTFSWIARVLLRNHLRRSILGFSLMVAQAFAYNAVFFTYALVLSRFYGVPGDKVGLYVLPFAVGNLLGPLLLGHLFDTVGRRTMIALTYAIAGVLLAATGWAFAHGLLTAATQTVLWTCVFFVASAAASSAYLTVSELFPVELRGMAIAFFYAAGTAAGGLAAPALFGALIQTGSRARVFDGYLIGAALMIAAALVDAVLGVAAEGRSLEELNS